MLDAFVVIKMTMTFGWKICVQLGFVREILVTHTSGMCCRLLEHAPKTFFLLPLSAAMATAPILHHWHQIPFVHQQ